jgi:hypothetical protein
VDAKTLLVKTLRVITRRIVVIDSRPRHYDRARCRISHRAISHRACRQQPNTRYAATARRGHIQAAPGHYKLSDKETQDPAGLDWQNQTHHTIGCPATEPSLS